MAKTEELDCVFELGSNVDDFLSKCLADFG